MPEISRFFGIIRMFYNDHSPPHFHAIYGDEEAEIDIETLAVIRGSIRRRALALILEWAAEHPEEPREDWRRVRAGAPTLLIAPLD